MGKRNSKNEKNHDHRLSRWFDFAPIRGCYLRRLKTCRKKRSAVRTSSPGSAKSAPLNYFFFFSPVNGSTYSFIDI